MRGKHLIADVININNYELLNTVEGIKPLMEEIIKDMDLHVVGEVHKQFEPIGATCLFLLSESHLSCHTYPEIRYCAIDLYCCNSNIDMNDVLEIIYNFFDNDCIITNKIIDR
jgi:S-adenosylmethionine decarboxylase